MRPVTPSRRKEKNRDASSKVQPAATLIRATPAAAQAVARQAGRSASHLPGCAGRSAAATRPAGATAKASSTSAPTSKARGPMQAPSQASSSAGEHAAASHRPPTVASSTPAARPRQPAWAAATARPLRARRTAPAGSRRPAPCRRRPGSVVTLASASCAGAPRRGVARRRCAPPACRGPGAGTPARRRRRRRSGPGWPATALRHVADGGAEVHRRERARRSVPPSRVVIRRADAPPAPGRDEPAGRTAHAASGQAEGWVGAERGLGHAGLEDAHHRRHVVEPAVHALGVVDLRHEHAVGEARRVAMAEAAGGRAARQAGARPPPGRSRPSAGTSGSCRPRDTLSSLTR